MVKFFFKLPMWYSRDSVSKQVSRNYSNNFYTVPNLYTFQFPIQIIELISAHLQRKIECNECYTLHENDLMLIACWLTYVVLAIHPHHKTCSYFITSHRNILVCIICRDDQEEFIVALNLIGKLFLNDVPAECYYRCFMLWMDSG